MKLLIKENFPNFLNKFFIYFMNITEKESADFTAKILLIGDSAVGKSSIISKYLDEPFNAETPSTLGNKIIYPIFEEKKVYNITLKMSLLVIR